MPKLIKNEPSNMSSVAPAQQKEIKSENTHLGHPKESPQLPPGMYPGGNYPRHGINMSQVPVPHMGSSREDDLRR